jgi:hypothetical protein
VAIFEAVTVVHLGNGERVVFWHDRWLDGLKVEDIAPNLVALFTARKVKERKVHDRLLMRHGVDVNSPSSWEPQEEGMMSIEANFPSIRNQGLSV